MPVTLKQHLESLSSTPMSEYYKAVDITPVVLAEAGKKLLSAKTVKHFKLRGWVDDPKKLAKGYKIVKGTVDETIIEHALADNGIRTKAWIEVCRQMGLYPTETVNVQHGFDGVIGDIIKEIHDNAKGLPPLPSMENDA